jgi:hypothetical protein
LRALHLRDVRIRARTGVAWQAGSDALVFLGGDDGKKGLKDVIYDRPTLINTVNVDWALLRPLRRLLKQFKRAAWFVFMDDVTHVNRERFKALLLKKSAEAQRGAKEMLSVGFALRDKVHSRVHHYREPGALAYPAIAAGWALSRSLVVRVARNVSTEKGFDPYRLPHTHASAHKRDAFIPACSLTSTRTLTPAPPHTQGTSNTHPHAYAGCAGIRGSSRASTRPAWTLRTSTHSTTTRSPPQPNLALPRVTRMTRTMFAWGRSLG